MRHEPELRKSERVGGKVMMYLCFLAVAYWLAGCATVTTGTTQSITVETDRPCEARIGDETTTITPERKTIVVAKSSRDLVIDCGESMVATLDPDVSAAGWTSILWIDFGIVDSMTGALWAYPETVDMRGAK